MEEGLRCGNYITGTYQTIRIWVYYHVRLQKWNWDFPSGVGAPNNVENYFISLGEYESCVPAKIGI